VTLGEIGAAFGDTATAGTMLGSGLGGSLKHGSTYVVPGHDRGARGVHGLVNGTEAVIEVAGKV